MTVSEAEGRFREAVKRLTDLVFTEDMEYFDALPAKVERELGTPLAALSDAIEEERPLAALRLASELVENIAAEIRDSVPVELDELIMQIRAARLALSAGN